MMTRPQQNPPVFFGARPRRWRLFIASYLQVVINWRRRNGCCSDPSLIAEHGFKLRQLMILGAAIISTCDSYRACKHAMHQAQLRIRRSEAGLQCITFTPRDYQFTTDPKAAINLRILVEQVGADGFPLRLAHSVFSENSV